MASRSDEVWRRDGRRPGQVDEVRLWPGSRLRINAMSGATSGPPAAQLRELEGLSASCQLTLRVDYTLPGVDVLLHRVGWSVQVSARRASQRGEPRATGSWFALRNAHSCA